jgi:pSer/pThr/pTyr-binding forkhead associated (FHA) protein
VEDLGSTNGTFLNEHKVAEPAPLSPGDRLRVGKTVIEVKS